MPRGKNYINQNKGMTLQAGSKTNSKGNKFKKSSVVEMCFYGAGCTRKDCIYRHPASREESVTNKSDAPCMPFLAGTCAFNALTCNKRHVTDPQERERLITKYAQIPCRHGQQCRQMDSGCLYNHKEAPVIPPPKALGFAAPPPPFAGSSLRPAPPGSSVLRPSPPGANTSLPSPPQSSNTGTGFFMPPPPPPSSFMPPPPPPPNSFQSTPDHYKQTGYVSTNPYNPPSMLRPNNVPPSHRMTGHMGNNENRFAPPFPPPSTNDPNAFPPLMNDSSAFPPLQATDRTKNTVNNKQLNLNAQEFVPGGR